MSHVKFDTFLCLFLWTFSVVYVLINKKLQKKKIGTLKSRQKADPATRGNIYSLLICVI
ncbi:hypothetical protein HanPI659440_Chr10g0363061 [Helianthus annuus]|nr:hypothetical protein HanPI659440_Chr10g0363061 [Helianthus annuus]